ncbi:MAG: hypothetical protein KKD44_28835 [Proteobacteria bacterium]|nr:hypothetical protein [Pseudomonadota bacterium]
MKEYDFNEIMKRFCITDDRYTKKEIVKESYNMRHSIPNLMDIAKLGAVIMRLEDEVNKLKRKK